MKIVIDTETTGTNNRLDEILQLSIIDYDTGAVLMDEYFKPAHKRRWFEAQRVNGISPALVADKRVIAAALSEIQAIFDQTSQVIDYNSSFDVGFLQVAGVTVKAPVLDVMLMFSPIYGEWNDYYGNYKWQSLTVAAAYFHYQWPAHAHNSLADCYATRFVYQKILERDNRIRLTNSKL
ncbi:exonuclease domain-containing protein [Lacticaseibacillus baoqingensis]|uniref:Exonuclease domain-containing protein n=1 Tax=Lacticaseibacillus baoqingensis TaxID=2486013 RepID=A0ABW4E6B8_9LACO|nr:3'-5' exonuclease [Lacticaseibacillus baoqingensis]